MSVAILRGGPDAINDLLRVIRAVATKTNHGDLRSSVEGHIRWRVCFDWHA